MLALMAALADCAGCDWAEGDSGIAGCGHRSGIN